MRIIWINWFTLLYISYPWFTSVTFNYLALYLLPWFTFTLNYLGLHVITLVYISSLWLSWSTSVTLDYIGLPWFTLDCLDLPWLTWIASDYIAWPQFTLVCFLYHGLSLSTLVSLIFQMDHDQCESPRLDEAAFKQAMNSFNHQVS